MINWFERYVSFSANLITLVIFVVALVARISVSWLPLPEISNYRIAVAIIMLYGMLATFGFVTILNALLQNGRPTFFGSMLFIFVYVFTQSYLRDALLGFSKHQNAYVLLGVFLFGVNMFGMFFGHYMKAAGYGPGDGLLSYLFWKGNNWVVLGRMFSHLALYGFLTALLDPTSNH